MLALQYGTDSPGPTDRSTRASWPAEPLIMHSPIQARYFYDLVVRLVARCERHVVHYGQPGAHHAVFGRRRSWRRRRSGLRHRLGDLPGSPAARGPAGPAPGQAVHLPLFAWIPATRLSGCC